MSVKDWNPVAVGAVVVVVEGMVVLVVVAPDVVVVEGAAIVVVVDSTKVVLVVDTGGIAEVGGTVGVVGSASSDSADSGAVGGSLTCDVTRVTAAAPTPVAPRAATTQMSTVRILRMPAVSVLDGEEGINEMIENS